MSMSTGASQPRSGCPGSLAEADQQSHVIEADFERISHGMEAGRISRYMTGFDRSPFRGLHT
jgi:hypothetical protein